jgi:CRP-like cAMP-binding protein
MSLQPFEFGYQTNIFSGPQSSSCTDCAFSRNNACSRFLLSDASPQQLRKTARFRAARQTVIHAGQPTDGVLVVCEGWAARFIQLRNGKRQLLSIVMPGDFVSALSVYEPDLNCSVQALTNVKFCALDRNMLRTQMQQNMALQSAWARLAAAEQKAADLHLVDLGQRTATERLAALFMRIIQRNEQRGTATEPSIQFPLKQQHIADLIGLTPVHVCRMISQLRARKVCDVREGWLTVWNRDELEQMAACR